MATKITRDIIESYLNCKYKGQLKLAEQQGVKSDYGVRSANRVATCSGGSQRLAEKSVIAQAPAATVLTPGHGGGGAFTIVHVRSRTGDCLNAERRVSQQDERRPRPSTATLMAAMWPRRGSSAAVRSIAAPSSLFASISSLQPS